MEFPLPQDLARFCMWPFLPSASVRAKLFSGLPTAFPITMSCCPPCFSEIKDLGSRCSSGRRGGDEEDELALAGPRNPDDVRARDARRLTGADVARRSAAGLPLAWSFAAAIEDPLQLPSTPTGDTDLV